MTRIVQSIAAVWSMGAALALVVGLRLASDEHNAAFRAGMLEGLGRRRRRRGSGVTP